METTEQLIERILNDVMEALTPVKEKLEKENIKINMGGVRDENGKLYRDLDYASFHFVVYTEDKNKRKHVLIR